MTRAADQRVATGIGAAAALVAAVVTLWGIDRPAVWTDEAATANAVRRSWGDLAHLLLGRDAPLVPYYVLAKIWFATIGLLHDGDPWTVCRWLSALLASACVGLLARWIAQRNRLIAVVAAGVLVALPGFDRFAQEARPYSAMMLLATWSWLELHRVVTGTAQGGVRYATGVALLAFVNPFALVQVVAQVAAVVLLRRRCAPSRPRTALRAAAVGVAIAAPWVVWSATHGRGPTATHRHVSWPQVRTSFTQMVAGPPTATTWPVLIVVAAAVLALGSIVVGGRHRDVAVVALLWAAAGPVLLPLAGAAVQVALVPRYWLSCLPGVALLVAVAVAALVDGVIALVPRAADGARFVLPALAVAGFVALGVGGQQSIRRSDGHGEDSAGAIRTVSSRRLRSLPLLFVRGGDALVIGEVRPALQVRIVGWDRSTGRNVSQTSWDARRTHAALETHRRALLLLRLGAVFRAVRTTASLQHTAADDLAGLRARGVDAVATRVVFQGDSWVVVECSTDEFAHSGTAPG